MDHTQQSDEQLVILLARENVDALGVLYDRHVRLVLGVATAVVRDHALAEEIAQDVFLKLWRQPESFDGSRGRFASWLVSVARHRAIDVLRSRRANVVSADDPQTSFLMLNSAADTPDPGEEAEQAEQRAIVRRALLALPDAQRHVLELAYFAGMSQSEIAQHLRAPLGTIKTRVRLAMQKLRATLDELGLEEAALL